jgi:histone-lysine N-methyltransferase NSD2
MPLYGEVLWVKLGVFRWWPARVVHPGEVPANIERLAHDIGEFPIQFCGSHEYFWMNRGRCFLYEEGDAEKIPGAASSKSLDGAYRRGLFEAAELFTQYTQVKKYLAAHF